MKIFDLLNEYTSDMGSWSIECNDHKITYSTPSEHYIAPEDDCDELDDIDTKQDIYRLYWFNNTPVGHYCILANSIEELEEKILDIIKNDNLTKNKTKEIKPKQCLNVSCKYKIQLKDKFDGKPYCTCFCELCEDLPICDDNCQSFEDYKELVQKLKEVEDFRDAIKKLNKENQNLFNKNLELEGEIAVVKRECKKLNESLDYADKQLQEVIKTKCSDCESVVIADNKKIYKSYAKSLDENHRYRKALEEIEKIIKEYDCVNCTKQHCIDCNKYEIFYTINKAKGEGC